jgi:hypothetical protein
MNTEELNDYAATSNQDAPLTEHPEKSIPVLLAEIDDAILKKAVEGDVEAARLCYQRFECWSAKGKGNFNVEINEA